MGFNTEKFRFRNSWEKSGKNSVDIENSQLTETVTIGNIRGLNRKNTILKTILDVSTNFSNFENQLDEEEKIIRSFKEFELIFERLDPQYIPYIYVDFVYRTSDSIPSAPIPTDPADDSKLFDESFDFDLFTNVIIRIEDIEGEDIVKRITYNSSILIENTESGLPTLQIRFLSRVLNPFYYN